MFGFNPESGQAFVLSIPRDTFVGNNEAKAGGFDKINALYQKSPKSPKNAEEIETVKAVENLTGIKINYYVTVKNSALVDIVDAIGGVEFDVPIDMDYDDPSQDLHIHLKAGKQKLNGDQAEQLVRFRHNNNGTSYSAEYGDNDEGRMRTQREFLKTVVSQVVQWHNVTKVEDITKAMFNNLETNMSLQKMLGYASYAGSFDTNNLEMGQLPGKAVMLNNLWFFKVDKQGTDEMVDGYIDKLGLDEREKKKYILDDEIKKSVTNTNKNNKSDSNNSTKKNTTTNQTKTKSKNTVNKNEVKSNNSNKKNMINDDDTNKQKEGQSQNVVKNTVKQNTETKTNNVDNNKNDKPKSTENKPTGGETKKENTVTPVQPKNNVDTPIDPQKTNE